MSGLKVLHIIWTARIGGIEKLVSNLCNAQLNNGSVTPSVLVAHSEDTKPVNFIQMGIPVFEPGFRNGRDSREEVITICKKAFEENDILHFHSFNPVISKLAVKSGKKIVYTEHGNFGFGRTASINDRVVRFLQQRFLNKHVHFITFNSEFSRRIAEDRYGLENKKKQVVYNGIPPPGSFNVPENNFRKEPYEVIITTIGRLATVKRIDRLIRSFALADHHRMQLIITGDGPLKPELETLCKEFNIINQVVFTGYQDSQEMIRNADLCVFPSQNEAFGLVAIEAYQEGKPVIVFEDGGGLPELVRKVEPSLIVADENELTALLNKINIGSIALNDISLIEKRKQFAASFSIEKMRLSLEEIYLSI